jgi:flagellar biosynthesis protein FlhG
MPGPLRQTPLSFIGGKTMQIIPIASGKGGVGKSLVAANLSIALAQSGHKVILADLDLGSSNIHLFLGIHSVTMGVGTYLLDSKVVFQDLLIQTEYNNLFFIPGDAEIPGLANITYTQKTKLIKNLLGLEADFLILDLGAGTEYNIIDFFLLSGKGIIVTMPSLAAILSAYFFLKTAVFRIMQNIFKNGSEGHKFLKRWRKDSKSLQYQSISKCLEELKELDPLSYHDYMQKVANFNPRLILNMLEDPQDAEKGERLYRYSQKNLGLNLEHLGVVYRDDLQNTALNAKIPIIKYKPKAVLSQAIYRISEKVSEFVGPDDSPLDLETIEAGFQIAQLEAESDFQNKMEFLEELLHCGALTVGDLVETVKTQQFEIKQLKKENQFLKQKLVKAVQAGFPA